MPDASYPLKIIELNKVDLAKAKKLIAGTGGKKLDWGDVAEDQGAKEKRWLDYNRK